MSKQIYIFRNMFVQWEYWRACWFFGEHFPYRMINEKKFENKKIMIKNKPQTQHSKHKREYGWNSCILQQSEDWGITTRNRRNEMNEWKQEYKLKTEKRKLQINKNENDSINYET